jgi:hypothetical protein
MNSTFTLCGVGMEVESMTNFESVARLRQLLFGMEQALGIDKLGAAHRNIVYAATLIAQKRDVISTEEIREHELLRDLPRSTFFKALKEVVSAGYLTHAEGAQRSSYILPDINGAPK